MEHTEERRVLLFAFIILFITFFSVTFTPQGTITGLPIGTTTQQPAPHRYGNFPYQQGDIICLYGRAHPIIHDERTGLLRPDYANPITSFEVLNGRVCERSTRKEVAPGVYVQRNPLTYRDVGSGAPAPRGAN